MTYNIHADLDNTINDILKKYLFETVTFELCDAVMEDVRRAFGPDVPAQVTVDTDTGDIEIQIRDILSNVRTYSVIANKVKETNE